jgi:hypothetical protein
MEVWFDLTIQVMPNALVGHYALKLLNALGSTPSGQGVPFTVHSEVAAYADAIQAVQASGPFRESR